MHSGDRRTEWCSLVCFSPSHLHQAVFLLGKLKLLKAKTDTHGHMQVHPSTHRFHTCLKQRVLPQIPISSGQSVVVLVKGMERTHQSPHLIICSVCSFPLFRCLMHFPWVRSPHLRDCPHALAELYFFHGALGNIPAQAKNTYERIL